MSTHDLTLHIDTHVDFTYALETYLIYPWVRDGHELVRPLRIGPKDTHHQDLEDYGRGSTRVTLHVHVGARDEMLRLGLKPDSEINHQPDGSVRITLYVDKWQWLVPLVASFGADVAAEEPPELRQALRVHHQRAASTYQHDNHGNDIPSYLHDDSRLRATRGRLTAGIGADARHGGRRAPTVGGMARANEEVAGLLQEYADLISITGGEQFKARVYERAARSVGGYSGDVATVDARDLRRIPNVGESIADKIVEYRQHGRMSAVDELRGRIPDGVRRLLEVPTLGPKRAMILYQTLHVASIEELAQALDDGRVRDLRGFGARTEKNLRHGIDLLRQRWIPPLPREDRGEIEAAAPGEPPDLVRVADLRGDLHTHTDLTDGVAPLAEMVAAAARLGYSYFAVTDHAPNLFMQRMSEDKMLAQRAELRTLSAAYPDLTLWHGTELNIGPDGQVDWPDDILAGFDLCVASIHSHFTQSRAELTRRLVRACENPYVTIIGHPTARMIRRRPGIDADFDAVFDAAARTGTILEVNGSPERLDLPDEHIRHAKRYGVRFAVDSDAHATTHLDNTRYGIGAAQRGWLGAGDVVNTWPVGKLAPLLRPTA